VLPPTAGCFAKSVAILNKQDVVNSVLASIAVPYADEAVLSGKVQE
jgi:hypothetical protein